MAPGRAAGWRRRGFAGATLGAVTAGIRRQRKPARAPGGGLGCTAIGKAAIARRLKAIFPDIDEKRLARQLAAGKGGYLRRRVLPEEANRVLAIGELALEGLKGLDDVAFVRFASVYKNFSAADDFRSFLAELGEEAKRPTPGEDD